MSKQFLLFLLSISLLFTISLISANNYTVDVYFAVPDSVYTASERVEFKGYVYMANYSNGSVVSNYSAFANANVNLTITNSNGTLDKNRTFVTDSSGMFYSRSNYFPNATEVNSSSSAGTYVIRAEYKDPNNQTWFSEVEISVVNQTIDLLYISSEKAKYNPSESVIVEIEAVRQIGDKLLHMANVSANGTLRNSSKSIITNINCTTTTNGKCYTTLTAPSNYGNYILELDNFKAIGGFKIVPFSVSVYMKDELGQSLKNVYAIGEQGKVEVNIANASDSDSYIFSGYISDSSGNVIKSISSTTLNSNNSFKNTYLFTVDSISFSYGVYTAYVNVSKSGDGSVSSSSSFKVKDWVLSVSKKSSNSGFKYEYSAFANETLFFEAYPTYRSNGSVIRNLSSTYFTVNLKDKLNNIVSLTNTSWNSSCGSNGCYEFNITSPINIGQYSLSVALSYSGATETETRVVNVIDTVMSAQSTDKDGSLKELFGTNDYVYLSLTSYNTTSSLINLSDAEVFVVSYMNNSEFSYTQLGNFSAVNFSNSVYEWAWNSTTQRIKLDVPKVGGLYNVYLFGNNRTVGTVAKFIVNPYEVCSVPKDTPGSVSSGYYYVWQFKKTDTIYFEIKLVQADNPLGRANVLNISSGNSTGMGAQCYDHSSTKQIISNATITISEVKNLDSGALQEINSSESVCQADDNRGGYTCTVKPLSKWAGGISSVKFKVQGQDGTTDEFYSRFESRAFYLYGWSQQWQNNPSSNISLNVQIYEAGNGWWGNYGSGGLSGTVTLKRIEYQGRDGEWIWPPVDSGYNVSNVPSVNITSGQGSVTLNVSFAPGGAWKTGYYRAVLQGTTTSGDSDYGYAWFGIKLWDVYGQPIECTSSSCEYKSYFNSKNNLTLYVKISKAGAYNYNYAGGEDIYGNVSIGVKKIQDCRTWPCKELNSTQYQSNTIVVNSSSKWYWNSNLSNANNYLLKINTTSGSWGTGYYSVVLDVNGTDTGYAWFNTIAFYANVRPTDVGGVNYKYSIKPSERMYFNVTATKGYKGWDGSYNLSDYLNVTIDDIVLRSWDETTFQQKEYNYPEALNLSSSTSINGSSLVNLSYSNGSWPNGYYYGELTLKNSDNETSTGWLWFNVKPFRVATSTSTYNFDDNQCANATINIYEPNWYSSTALSGNYSIISVYEDVWGVNGRSRTNYTNYTTNSFNATRNITICPSGSWGSGSWGGYHYLTLIVRDNSDNSTENGWLSFRAVPFQIAWGSIVGGTGQLATANIITPVNISKYSTGQNSSGNLTRIYQWRYDNYRSTQEYYNFSVGSCYSNVSGQCTASGYTNITVYAPSGGWRVGYNYLYTVWTKQNDASSIVQDWSGIYFDGRSAYNGYFSNSDRNSNYKYDFRENENLTIKLYVRASNYHPVDVNVTDVQYALSGSGCWDDWCRTYTSASSWSLISRNTSVGSDGTDIIDIQVPSTNWTAGNYYIKATVSGANGTATITGGSLRVKDMVAPNVSISSPIINQSITGNNFSFSATTSERATCSFSFVNYGSFNNWYCGGASNSSNSTTLNGLTDSCNATKYNFNGSTYYHEWVSKDYHSVASSSNYDYWYQSGASGIITDSTSHTFSFNTTNKVTRNILTSQAYGVAVWCYDSDWNSGSAYVAFKINVTQNDSQTNPQITINTPLNGTYYNTSIITFNFTSNENGSCYYSLNSGASNYSMPTANNRNFNITNSSMVDGNYLVYAYCNDTYGNKNYTVKSNFTVDTTFPLIDYGTGTAANGINLVQNSTYVNVSFTEINFANITFAIWNSTSQVNSTTFTNSTYIINWTNLRYANHSYNVSIYDKAGNRNFTSTRYLNLSAA